MLRTKRSLANATVCVLSAKHCVSSALPRVVSLPLLLHLSTARLRWLLRVSRPWPLAAVFVPSKENDMTVEYIVLTPEQMLVLFNVLEG